ncbi:MAG: toxin-antitoxin system [Candidatus Contendobacter sp.]|nr:toxin-antitoxin system [Candidatus Contendobacter sp.]
MAQFTVRNVEEAVKVGLKQRAARHGCSLEEEVRRILRAAVYDEIPPRQGLGSRIAAYFAEGLTEDLPELRGQLARPANFEP